MPGAPAAAVVSLSAAAVAVTVLALLRRGCVADVARQAAASRRRSGSVGPLNWCLPSPESSHSLGGPCTAGDCGLSGGDKVAAALDGDVGGGEGSAAASVIWPDSSEVGLQAAGCWWQGTAAPAPGLAPASKPGWLVPGAGPHPRAGRRGSCQADPRADVQSARSSPDPARAASSGPVQDLLGPLGQAQWQHSTCRPTCRLRPPRTFLAVPQGPGPLSLGFSGPSSCTLLRQARQAAHPAGLRQAADHPAATHPAGPAGPAAPSTTTARAAKVCQHSGGGGGFYAPTALP